MTNGLTILTVLLVAGGISSAALAADNITTTAAGNTKIVRSIKKHVGEKQANKNINAAKKTDMQNKLAAVKAAISASDYTAWATAQTALNPKSILLQKLNAGNFSKYVEAMNLRAQADTIMKSLNLNK